MGAFVSLKGKLPLIEPDLPTTAIISPERMNELRSQAEANVAKRLAEAAEKKFLSDEERRLERAASPRPEYEMRSIVLDLADHSDNVRIDGQYFFHGQMYTVAKPVFDQLQEISARGWAHEREISVPTRRVMSNNRGAVLHGGDGSGSQGARF